MMICALGLLCIVSFTVAQSQNPDSEGSCNVVCNCNSGQPLSFDEDEVTLSQGKPGKRGSKGDNGPIGPKGYKGDTGLKGQKGNDADGVLISSILRAISATSCADLVSNYGVNKTGYYLMRDEETNRPVYNYCDFTIHRGATSCADLVNNYGVNKTGYYLMRDEETNRPVYNYCDFTIHTGIYTCQGLQDRLSISESGYYQLRSLVGNPFQVYCDIDHGPVKTEIRHNVTGERAALPGCEGYGCYEVSPEYELSQSDIIKIIDNSVSCRQFIKFKCKGSVIANHAWWISRNDEKMLYWGVANSNGYCACGVNGNCIDNGYKCNCDQNSRNVITSDEGYLTDKTKLPVKKIRLGDMGDVGEAGWYTLGNLECFGQI